MQRRALPSRTLPALFLAFLLAMAAAARAAGAQAQPAHSAYWLERTSFFETFQGHADVAMVGDSLTDGAEWAEMFPGVRIANRGIDGDTVQGVLQRVDGILALQPSRIFVMLGINDFAEGHRTVAAVASDYQALLARLQQGGAEVVVQSTLPCNVAKGAWKGCAALNPRIARLNARLAAAAQGRVRFVSLAALAGPDGGLRPELTYDGVHLNGAGYRLWQQAIAPLMP